MTNAVQKTESPRAPIEVRGGMVQIQTLEDAYRFAQYVVKSSLAPKAFSTPEQVMIAWQHGAELGLKPMQALQNIAVINGRPSVYGKAAAGIVMNSGLVETFQERFEGKIEDGTLTAVCTVKRKDISDVKTVRFGMEDAKRAGLMGKDIYKAYPQDMLTYKARARAFGALFGDVLCGLPLTEDIIEVPAERTPLTTEAPAQIQADPLLEDAVIVQEAQEVTVDPNNPLGLPD